MTDERPQYAEDETLDLAAPGQKWAAPAESDTPPEVSDLIAETPWLPARALLYIVLSFLAVALTWARFGKVDVVVESRGALVPEGSVRPVQAAAGGMVQYVFVREGDRVERGQPLIQIEAADSRARLARLRGELTVSREQLRQSRAAKGPVSETLEQENRISRLQSEITGAESGLKQTTILAPVGGLVTTLTARSPGMVLQAGLEVATIAPTGARLVAEAQLANKDIAFIEKGLPAKIKIDAFPFQDYGILTGRVIEVSPDAVAGRGAESFYKLTIALDQTSVTAHGKSFPLRPGLALTAEIVTERKSILDLLLDPFRQF
jgi:multidrug efflux pump subunit AcrA (membrane-fusion protein)